MPPCWCRLPCKNPGSTRVPSMEMMKIRTPFLAIERGTAAKTTTACRQKERRNKCASTMLVTSNIRLERKLLHSWATSRLNPGIVNMIPFCVTGTPSAENSQLAEMAEPCCQRATNVFNVASGIGTRQNRKQSGKSNNRKVSTPKQTMNDPSHQVTTASMPHVICASDAGVNLPTTTSNTAAINKTGPTKLFALLLARSEGHSV